LYEDTIQVNFKNTKTTFKLQAGAPQLTQSLCLNKVQVNYKHQNQYVSEGIKTSGIYAIPIGKYDTAVRQ
jgi:hypothetical protein